MTQPAVIKITSREVAQVLRQEKNVLLLRYFMGDGTSVAAVSQATGLAFHTVYRFVKQMERFGVLQIADLKTRAGRAMKIYVCPNRRFFIPKELFSLEESLWETALPVIQTIQRNLASAFEADPHGVRGVVVGDLPADNWMLVADAHGKPYPSEEWGPTPDSPPAFAVSHKMNLDYEQAQSFSQELFTLVERYRMASGGGTYHLLLLMAPQKG